MSKTSSTSVGRDSDKFMLRFPDGMRNQIAEAAELAGRSMNSEIIARLQESFVSSDHKTVEVAPGVLVSPDTVEDFQELLEAIRAELTSLSKLKERVQHTERSKKSRLEQK